MFELDMHSAIWSQIESTGLRPNYQLNTSLIPVTVKHLVFYGDSEGWGFTRIFDVEAHRWNEHKPQNVAYDQDHTGMTGLHGSAVILGEFYHSGKGTYHPVITVRLEPKSLQQLAMQMIYQNVDRTLWKMLPNKLKCKMGTS